MGDYFRTIVDRAVPASAAPALAQRVMDYMIGRRIIQAVRSDCVLRKEFGFAPGENVEEALARWTPAGTPGAPLPVDQIVSDLRGLATNGVVEVVGRTVFHNAGGGLDIVRCPLCLANEVASAWGEIVARWHEGDDLAALQCTSCNESSPVTEWTFDPPWAFGNLGFEFWNWPPLNRNFVNTIAGILGHKVAVVVGKV
jgi:hypothetical protein